MDDSLQKFLSSGCAWAMVIPPPWDVQELEEGEQVG